MSAKQSILKGMSFSKHLRKVGPMNRNALLKTMIRISVLVLLLGYSDLSHGKAGSSSLFQLDGLTCEKLVPLMSAFARAHISEQRFDSEFIDKIADQFVKRVDPSKNLLLADDAKEVEGIVKTFLSSRNNPDCSGIRTIPDILIKRSKEQLEYARSVLGPKYKLDENVEIVMDSKKRERAKDVSENNARQLKLIHFQVSNYMLNDMKVNKARTKLVHRYELNLKRIEEFSETDLFDSLVNAFASALDPHSSYLGKEVLEDFQIAMSLSLEGIGASLTSEDGYTVIQELIDGGAAAKSELLSAKDKILAVGQNKSGPMTDVVDMDLRDVVKLIRGKSGSHVRLNILRQGKDTKTFTVTLKRSKVTLADEAVQLTFEEVKVGKNKLKLAYLLLPSFYGDADLKRSCSKDILAALEKINQEKADGVLLDFARNGGGRLEEAVRIADFFIARGKIVATKDSRKRITKLPEPADEDKRIQYRGPLAILTSRQSASASEIVAGALKDYGRALIIGADHTYGKGSVQAVLPLPSVAGAIKVTTGLFFIPGGKSTQHTGVLADIELPSLLSGDDIGEQYLDNSLRPEAIANFISESANPMIEGQQAYKPITAAEIASLRSASEKRVSANDKFIELKKELAEMEETKGIVKLAEVRKKSVEIKKKEGGKEKSIKERRQERDAPQIAEAFNILADLIAIRRGWDRSPIAALK